MHKQLPFFFHLDLQLLLYRLLLLKMEPPLEISHLCLLYELPFLLQVSSRYLDRLPILKAWRYLEVHRKFHANHREQLSNNMRTIENA